MTTLAVAATLIVVGVPSFNAFIRSNRTTAHTNDLAAALSLARSEAIHRGTAVTVCSSTDGASCSASNDWTTGWIAVDAGGNLLRAWPRRSGGANVVTGNTDRVQFLPRGNASAGGLVFDIELPGCTGPGAREVRVNAAGRVSVARVNC